MFKETSIAHKDDQGAFTKTSSPLVASLKVVTYLFLIFLFDFLVFFVFLSCPFVLFYLQKRARNNIWSACWPPWPPKIHSVHPNVVLYHLMRKFPAELKSWNQLPEFAEVPICQCRVHLSHTQVSYKVSVGTELSCPCPLSWNKSISYIVVVVYLMVVA